MKLFTNLSGVNGDIDIPFDSADYGGDFSTYDPGDADDFHPCIRLAYDSDAAADTPSPATRLYIHNGTGWLYVGLTAVT